MPVVYPWLHCWRAASMIYLGGGTGRWKDEFVQPLKSWPRPLRVSLAYLCFLVPALIWFCWESNWGRYPDSSQHRDAVYAAYFLVLPVAIATFIIHLIATFCSSRQIQISIAVAVVCGFAGLFTLHQLIRSSQDSEAEMAYLLLPIFFSGFALAGFVLSSLFSVRV